MNVIWGTLMLYFSKPFKYSCPYLSLFITVWYLRYLQILFNVKLCRYSIDLAPPLSIFLISLLNSMLRIALKLILNAQASLNF